MAPCLCTGGSIWGSVPPFPWLWGGLFLALAQEGGKPTCFSGSFSHPSPVPQCRQGHKATGGRPRGRCGPKGLGESGRPVSARDRPAAGSVAYMEVAFCSHLHFTNEEAQAQRREVICSGVTQETWPRQALEGGGLVALVGAG